MYAVVGCSDCQALTIVEGRPETTQCPRCGKRRKFEKLKTFVETDDEEHAREVRSSMLANRQGEGEAFAELDSFAEMESQVEEAVVADDEYLEASGIDSDEVEAAAERVENRSASTRGSSRKDTVLAALRDLDRPTEEEVVAYASDEGVPAEYVRDALDKLTRRGEVSESRGHYRLL
ncbi:DUF5817 domain-containing protein [Halorussus salinus]|uniref:DUF5817 domain-containing protein n=1 Tax=Halorussus salinus TaxID=1364935 RepID=UPI0010932646|nr:DUF5817 domain-containing protein [Halorussus salinus]